MAVCYACWVWTQPWLAPPDMASSKATAGAAACCVSGLCARRLGETAWNRSQRRCTCATFMPWSPGLISEFAPDGVAIESVFTALNMKTALRLAEVRGVILLAAAQAGIASFSYSPREVKATVAGYGNAGKEQVQQMVRIRPGYERNARARLTPPTHWPWRFATCRWPRRNAAWRPNRRFFARPAALVAATVRPFRASPLCHEPTRETGQNCLAAAQSFIAAGCALGRWWCDHHVPARLQRQQSGVHRDQAE